MTLQDNYPNLAKEWHPTKNGDLTPDKISYGSHKKVWWLCDKKCEYGCLHEYEQAIKNRTLQNQGCSYCSKKLLCYHNSLEFKYPEISKQWHPTKNGELTPDRVSRGSEKKVWWLCDKKCEYGCIHEYEQRILNKTLQNQGCSYCSNILLCYHNSLEFKYPEISKQWHPTKNNNLTPDKVSYGSHKKVWWLCNKKCEYGCLHEWQATVKNRTLQKAGCPYCTKHGVNRIICYHQSVAFQYPEISEQWHPTKNGDLTLEKVSCGSELKIWWICSKNSHHIWECVCKSRTLSLSSCPICISQHSKMQIKWLNLSSNIASLSYSTY